VPVPTHVDCSFLLESGAAARRFGSKRQVGASPLPHAGTVSLPPIPFLPSQSPPDRLYDLTPDVLWKILYSRSCFSLWKLPPPLTS